MFGSRFGPSCEDIRPQEVFFGPSSHPNLALQKPELWDRISFGPYMEDNSVPECYWVPVVALKIMGGWTRTLCVVCPW